MAMLLYNPNDANRRVIVDRARTFNDKLKKSNDKLERIKYRAAD